MFMKSKTLHNGAIFAMSMQGKCLYTGGSDTNVNIQVEMQHLVLCLGNYKAICSAYNILFNIVYSNTLEIHYRIW